MKAKTQSASEIRLYSSFEDVRKKLANVKFEERRKRPLAYWVLPTDRRLPLAFLGLTLNEILAKSFDDLSATSGIGQKKIATLVTLLHRAAQEKQPETPHGVEIEASRELAAWNAAAESAEFDVTSVSGAHWALWQETVRRHKIGQVRFGRVARSLRDLPTVIWNTPLGDYLDCTLEELRSRKTHGEKRVRVVLETFFTMHSMLGGAQPREHIRFSFKPKFADPIEAWIEEAIHRDDPPNDEEVEQKLIAPLLDQIELDLGQEVRELCEGRLGVFGGGESVRSQSRRLGVTRARIYQLFEDASDVMGVRWPEGRSLFNDLLHRFWIRKVEEKDAPGHLLFAARDLFFPSKFEQFDETSEEAVEEATMA